MTALIVLAVISFCAGMAAGALACYLADEED